MVQKILIITLFGFLFCTCSKNKTHEYESCSGDWSIILEGSTKPGKSGYIDIINHPDYDGHGGRYTIIDYIDCNYAYNECQFEVYVGGLIFVVENSGCVRKLPGTYTINPY